MLTFLILFITVFLWKCSSPDDPEPSNNAPSISILTADQDSVELNGSCELSCEASDPDDDNLTYSWEASSGDINGSGADVTWVAPNSVGVYTISCTVNDGKEGQDIQSINIKVFSANTNPVINSLTANPDTININDTSTVTCDAKDEDGDILTFDWYSVSGEIDGSGEVIGWIAPNSEGTYYVVCTISDGNGGESIDSVKIVVEDNIPTQGLIAYYPFNGNANDVSGNDNHGTIHGNSVQFVTGVFDQAIKFDNSNSRTFTVNDYVELPKITVNEFSIAHWVRFISGSSTSYDGCTYSIGEFPHKLFNVRIKNSGIIKGQIILNNVYYDTPSIDISDHEWHFLAVTVSRDYLKLYHDGALIDSVSLGFDLNFEEDFQQIALHRFSGSMSSRFTGELDNVRIYGKSLKPDEIANLFNE